ncbi:MAG: dienelactone hydrolase family protein [Agrococcus casei]
MVINSSSDAQVHWYGPEGAPLAVVLHDFMGRLPWTDAVARRLVEAGHRVAVPDFYSGRTTTDVTDARTLMRERLDTLPDAMRVLQEIVGEARAFGSPAVALIGYSMGVKLALAYAAEHPGVDAVAAVYGGPIDPQKHVRVPVLFQLAGDDVDAAGSSPAHELQQTMAAEGFDGIEIEMIADARHGFANEQRDDVYDRDASEQALARAIEYLSEQLPSA